MGVRDNWPQIDASVLASLPANDDTAGDLEEIDTTPEHIIGVEVETDAAKFDYVFAATAALADVAFAADANIRRVFATGLPILIPCKQTANKLYIRGVDNAAATVLALSYNILRG